MNFAFRVDASIHMGSGHVARCATLADYLRQCGGNSTFICRELPGHYCDWLAERGYAVQRLPAPSSVHHRSPDGLAHAAWLGVPKEQEIREAGEALRQVGHVDWLIVDHYALDAEWEQAMRAHVPRIMVIDDLADRSHDADLLLDQNLQPHAGRYNNLLPPSCAQLLGPAFALLRPEFSETRAVLAPRNGEVRRVLVFMGGGDIQNITGKILDTLTGPETDHLAMDIVITKGSPYYEELQFRCSILPNCTLHVQTTNMASLMAKADLMIGGSGSATWERCCLGLPSVLISIAENQRTIGREISRHRAAIYLGDYETLNLEKLQSVLSRLIYRPKLLRHIGNRALSLVDGRGSDRVILCMCREESVQLRHATIDDATKVWPWRNHPETRRYFIRSTPVPLAEHHDWWDKILACKTSIILLGSRCKVDIGVLRFDLQNTMAVVSIYLDPAFHGLGLGTALLRAGENWLHVTHPSIQKCEATILLGNVASQRTFYSAGYRMNVSHGRWERLICGVTV
jgi:UDP-2,4-diacetamido-2,4,6-trideoxy-beta-L-altropyranose hydrolase